MTAAPREHAETVPETTIEIVLPVHNEEAQLAGSVERLLDHLDELPWATEVVIADNASTDATALAAHRLARSHDGVRVIRLEEKGRGRALKQAWTDSDADVLVYMDIDLSTDLDALLPLVAPLVSGHSDLAIGTRLARGSRVVRGTKRELISRGYNLLLRGTMRARFSDAQCGFKAIRGDAARSLVPLVVDDEWFFDTELLLLAQRTGLRIHEVPVDWVDDPDSSVDIGRTALADVRGMVRVGATLARGRLPLADVAARLGRPLRPDGTGRQVARFLAMGLASTALYTLLFVLARLWLPAQAANLTALLLSAIANTAMNRRYTFGVRGRQRAVRHQLQGLAVFAVGLAATSGTLAWSDTLGGGHRLLEVVCITTANLAVTVLKFAAMRFWMFSTRHK